MWYMGGKFRQASGLMDIIGKRHVSGVYYEPFCGALGSAEKLVPFYGNGTLSDASAPVVNMWNAVIGGWDPPDFVSEDTYAKYASRRHCPDADDPMTAYCGYAMSFGGKWFGGYARSGAGVNKTQMNQKAAVLRKVQAIRSKATVHCADYTSVIESIPHGAVVYLDPPYAGGTKAHHTAIGFDHTRFWDVARALSSTANVYVTEFSAPRGWTAIHSFGDTVVRHGGTQRDDTNERIFVWDGV